MTGEAKGIIVGYVIENEGNICAQNLLSMWE